MNTVKVAVNGYGIIGKRVADAVVLQDDMELVGVADIVSDYRLQVAALRRYDVYVSTSQADQSMRAAPRIAFIRMQDGLVGLNSTVELMSDLGRPRGDMWEVALWEDVLTVEGDQAYFTYQVFNQAIVVPETIDAIRALAGVEPDASCSIARTDAALGVARDFLRAEV